MLSLLCHQGCDDAVSCKVHVNLELLNHKNTLIGILNEQQYCEASFLSINNKLFSQNINLPLCDEQPGISNILF